ncbi:hypothetical protein, partial [Escherichia coli]|uniref:hypothetical protein n=1 Tax=Escherichia coli TaxID=562 RepID=UPI00200EC6BE
MTMNLAIVEAYNSAALSTEVPFIISGRSIHPRMGSSDGPTPKVGEVIGFSSLLEMPKLDSRCKNRTSAFKSSSSYTLLTPQFPIFVVISSGSLWGEDDGGAIFASQFL